MKPQSFLALFGAGYTTGLSVDLGEDITEINPIYEGGSITYANMETNVAGCVVKDFMDESLKKRGHELDVYGSDKEKILDDIWDLIYVTPNCAVTREQYKKEFQLPSGELIDVSQEVFFAGEMYFSPEEVTGEKSNKLPIQEALVTSILKIDDGLHAEMIDTIVAHGGRLTMPGFHTRLGSEMAAILNRPVHILPLPETYSVAWMGGSVFAAMTGADRLWVTKKQFEEHGDRLVRNRFL